jgi:hypothetical protein
MRNPLIFLIPIPLVTGATEAKIGSPKSKRIIERGVETGTSPKATVRELLEIRPDNLCERQEALDTCAHYSGSLWPK